MSVPIKVTILSVLALGLPSLASANECGRALNKIAQQRARALIEQQPLCKDLKTRIAGVTVGIDNTKSVKLDSLKLCLQPTTFQVLGTVSVTCATSDAATFKTSISETFDITLDINTDTCQASRVEVRPRGEVGKQLASLLDASGSARRELQKSLDAICQ